MFTLLLYVPQWKQLGESQVLKHWGAGWNLSEIGRTRKSCSYRVLFRVFTEKAQCKVGLQPTGMNSGVEPKQMGSGIKVNKQVNLSFTDNAAGTARSGVLKVDLRKQIVWSE